MKFQTANEFHVFQTNQKRKVNIVHYKIDMCTVNVHIF